ncbi:ferredoxin [Streptomyces sp. BE303]|uniref:ferredoxin n=1 Tax=Streptomyces sp. BE303 TaxID=3002528 RepID=UPI002E780DF3|nr:ferredoxin [Streptomyces sp. BE303]MED7952781.1 ferredoxin [Streptomyces sp. BE303]
MTAAGRPATEPGTEPGLRTGSGPGPAHGPATAASATTATTATAAQVATHAAEPVVVVRVNRDRCIGSAMCANTAPGSLTLGADGLARPLNGPFADADDDLAAEFSGEFSGHLPEGLAGEHLTPELADAVDFCPVEALALYAAHDGRPISPTD